MVRILQTWCNTWLEKTIPLYPVLPGYQVPKVKHESMFNLEQEGLHLNASLLMQYLLDASHLGHLSLLHAKEFLNRASGMTVMHPHALLLSC